MLKSLNDLSLTITTGGESTPAAATAAGTEGEVAVKTEPAESAAPVQTKTINVNVELIKFGAKKNANSTGANASAEEVNAAGEAQNGGEAEAVVGGTDVGGGARIESVDTTTV